MPESPHAALVVTIFCIVYLGMILGGLPRLHLDRTGVALLGAIGIVGAGVSSPEAAARSIHLATILLLFSFMVISAQMRLGGFYAAVTRRVAALAIGPRALMAVVIAVAALLSAVFTNDIVCLAMAPVLADACLRRRLDPVPYLLALACASNIGSAATLIGNPQNMLIGEVLRLPFAAYSAAALPPVAAALVALWALLAWRLPADGVRHDGTFGPSNAAGPTRPATRIGPARPADAAHRAEAEAYEPPFDRWQTAKGLVIALALMLVFLFTNVPRDVAALVGAGVLLLSQRFHSSRVMSLVDWELLVLFMGLFVVNHAFEQTGLAARLLQHLVSWGIDLHERWTLFGATILLSNLVSNVPAVMLLLPAARGGGGAVDAGTLLAIVSTLAGNLLIVGSIANIIVVDAARKRGIEIDWWRHARTGVPVTLVSLTLAAAWLAWRPGGG